jgi:serine-type D-Ala-D-Ala carboxypeptidase
LKTKLDQIIETYLGDVFPALALVVIHQGNVLLDAAWGWIDPETQRHPVTPDTLFDLASVTKLFTATAFLSLVSEGVVGLDDPLTTVIPEFGQGGLRALDGGQDPHTKQLLPIPDSVQGKMTDPAQVTFRHLLTHTSGLAPWRQVDQVAGSPPSPPGVPDSIPRAQRLAKGLAAIYTSPFVAQPGESVNYSDLGLILLGEAVSRLHDSHGTLESAVQTRVLDPLGLTTLRYNPVANGIERDKIAPTENDPDWRERRCWGEVHDENACGLGGVAGHAGLFGTAADVARFGLAWLENDGRLPISSQLMTLAKQEQAVSGDLRRGLGWLLKAVEDSSAGDKFSPDAYGHTGFTGTSLWIDPVRELVVVCLTNRVYPGRHKLGIHAFRRALHDALGLRTK